jgi:hypothetical protein
MRYNLCSASKLQVALALGLFAGVCAARAHADTTLTFAPQNGASDSPFVSDTESGFTVTPTTQNNWFVGQLFGDPVPSIYDGPIGTPTGASILVTAGGADFTFLSLDDASNNGASNFVIVGIAGLISEFTESGQFAMSGSSFTTYSSTIGDSTVPIDNLDITIFPLAGTSSVNLDNIVLGEPVLPEPASASIGLGLAALGLQRRRRKVR